MSQFLAPAEQIAARLRAQLLLQAGTLGFVPVYTAPVLVSLEDKLPAPCIFVELESHTAAETPSSGHPVRLTQNWQVTACVRHQAATMTGRTAQAKLSSMADIVIAALIGWRPETSKKPMTLSGSQKKTIEDGHIFLPLVFETETIYHKSAT